MSKNGHGYCYIPKRVHTHRIHDSVSKIKTVGKLALFHDNWQTFTNDQWVLDAVSGYKIEFVQNPHQTSVPSGISFNDKQRSVVDNEVVQLL